VGRGDVSLSIIPTEYKQRILQLSANRKQANGNINGQLVLDEKLNDNDVFVLNDRNNKQQSHDELKEIKASGMCGIAIIKYSFSTTTIGIVDTLQVLLPHLHISSMYAHIL
jgi:hypothetical protein